MTGMEEVQSLSELEAFLLLMLLADELSADEGVEVLARCAGRTGKLGSD